MNIEHNPAVMCRPPRETIFRVLIFGATLAAVNGWLFASLINSAWACNRTVGWGGICLTLVALLLTGTFEAALITFSFQISTWFENVWTRSVLVVTSCVFVTCYFVFIGANWLLFSKLGVFVGPSHLVSLASDTAEFLRWVPDGDRLWGLCLVVGALIMSLVSRACVLSIIGRRSLPIVAVGAICVVAVLVLIRVSPRILADVHAAKRLESCVLDMASPTAHLLRVFGFADDTTDDPTHVVPCRQIDNPPKRAPNPMNVVLLNVEAFRADVLDMPNVQTAFPNISKMASEGVAFPRAYAASNESVYSSISMLTGLFARRTPLRDSFSDPKLRPKPLYDFLDRKTFRSAYFSATSERWQNVGRVVQTRSLDLFFASQDESTSELHRLLSNRKDGDRVSDSLSDVAQVEKFREWLPTVGSNTFFARFYFVSSHFPFYPAPPDYRIFQPWEIPDDILKNFSFLGYPVRYIPEMKNRYLNALAFVDSLVGEVRDAVTALGLENNTVFIITGDHGEQFGEHGKFNHGTSLYEKAVRVPLVFWSPQTLEVSMDPDLPVSHVDVAPTVLSLMGQGSDVARFQGQPLVAVGETNKQSSPRAVFLTTQGFLDQDAVVVWPYKLIRDNATRVSQLFELNRDPEEAEDRTHADPRVARCLEGMLALYRSTQRAYFYELRGVSDGCLAPQYEPFARQCATLFPNQH